MTPPTAGFRWTLKERVFQSRKDTAVFLPRAGSTTCARTLLWTQVDFRSRYRAFRACSRGTFADIRRRTVRLRSNGGSSSRWASKKLTCLCGFRIERFFFNRSRRETVLSTDGEWILRGISVKVSFVIEQIGEFRCKMPLLHFLLEYFYDSPDLSIFDRSNLSSNRPGNFVAKCRFLYFTLSSRIILRFFRFFNPCFHTVDRSDIFKIFIHSNFDASAIPTHSNFSA